MNTLYKIILIIIFHIFGTGILFSQISIKPKDSLVKDPYFDKVPPNYEQQQSEKVKLIHSDFAGVKPEKYNGNFYFEGNVKFSHQGSVITADEVVVYQEENFVKAYGNVKLENADGSVITSEEMEYDGNSERGVARKNVTLTDPKQTIKTETLYYDRLSDQAYFDTGGTIYTDQSVTYSKTGTYYIASKIVDIAGNVKIDDSQYILEGEKISQNQLTNVAIFSGPTTITSKKNAEHSVYTEGGSYNQNTKEVFLDKNSVIYYNGKILTGDKMYSNQITGFSKATGNVLLRDPKEKRFIKGGYGEVYEKKDSAIITDQPLAVKILEKDSVYFSAEKILSYQRADSADAKIKKSFMRAFKKARMFKTNVQARGDSLSFDETDGILHLFTNPILWSGEKQITGDKIEAYFNTEKENIDSLKVIGNAFAISKADSLNLKDEFHQVKGRLMTVYYKNNEINIAKVIGNAQAITYADDQNQKTKQTERIGVALSVCGMIEALFEERKIQILECNIASNTDIYPMSKISKEQRFFTDFNWNTKDRIRKWQDIFLDTPNYEEIKYESDDALFNRAQKAINDAKAAEEAKKPKRVRK